MKKFSLLFIVILIGVLSFQSCKKDEIISEVKPPIARAGTDITIKLPTDSVTLNGSSSYGSDGISSYAWSKISGPTSFNLINPDAAITKVKNLVAGIYNFQLKVIAANGRSATDTVQVIIDDPGINQPPVAHAGIDQSVFWPTNTITLDGRNSSDPENNIIVITWSKISGPSSSVIGTSNALLTQVTNITLGNYQFELRVTDNGGLTARDTVKVNVTSPPVSGSCDNRPVINANLLPVGSLSTARVGLVSATAGNKILFAGGSIPGAYSSRVDIYDISTNTWSTAELTIPERAGMAVASVGNKIFFAGGGDNDWTDITSRIDIYDASSNTWSTAELSQPRKYLAAVTVGDNIYFAGGGRWGPIPGGPPPHLNWPPNADYYIGSDVVDIYNNKNNSWSTARLSEGRFEITATAAGNKVYFAGGLNNIFTGSNKIDILDIATNTWSTSHLLQVKASHASIAANNKIFWAGGANSSYQSGYVSSNTIEIRDINTGVSSLECIAPKSGFSAVLKDDNVIFFTGNNSSNVFEIYNTTTNKWSIGLLPVSIHGATIISINNTVYVAGGIVNGSYSNQVWKLEF